MQKQVSMALIGAGNRGRGAYGNYALNNPHRAKFVAVVEPDQVRRDAFAAAHGIPESLRFEKTDDLFSRQGKIADAMVIATLEDVRVDVTLKSIAAGYHILIEKPLGLSAEDIVKITDAASRYDGVFVVCHQMRHMRPYAVIKSLITSGRFGDIVTVHHSENISYIHMAHSFVRGICRNLTPLILSKCCHDMDMLRYLVDRRPVRISSFGGLNYFTEENAPEGATDYCLDGCPAYRECPYHVQKIYFHKDVDQAHLRQMGVVQNKKQLFELLQNGQYGKCVFKSDNTVVDHQVVNIEFAGGVTAAMQFSGHNVLEQRITKISMTNGDISFFYTLSRSADSVEGVVVARSFEPLTEETIDPGDMSGGHMGGDQVIMDAFVDAICTGKKADYILTPVETSLDSHLMSFAAEKARVEGVVIDMKEFEESCRT